MINREYVKLADVSKYINQSINVNYATLDNYISTVNMLPEKQGITKISDLPKLDMVNSYLEKDILVSNIRPYFKKIWYAKSYGTNSNDVLVIRADKSIIYNKYLYYCLFEDKYFDFMMKSSKGTKMPRGDKDAIMNYEIPFPPLPTQRRIADILSALDDKIENNLKTSEKLEQIAQSIFKRWFVDFDFPDAQGQPYKSSGGKMVESELGLIPEGWKVCSIKEFCVKIQNGGTPKRNNEKYWNSLDVPWLTSGEVRKNIINGTSSHISRSGFENSSAKWLPSFATVVALYGATAGQVALLSIKTTTNQAVCGLIPKNNYTFFNYLALQYSTKQLFNKAIGSAQQNISKSIVEELIFISPDSELLSKFDMVVTPIFYKIISMKNENDKLQQTRDVLLPKLMSGELEV